MSALHGAGKDPLDVDPIDRKTAGVGRGDLVRPSSIAVDVRSVRRFGGLPGDNDAVVGDPSFVSSLAVEDEQLPAWIKAMYAYRFEKWVNCSKRGRPSFNVGDLLVVYVGGTNCCYAAVSVAGETRNDPAFLVANGRSTEEAERWPWVTPVEVRLRLPETHGAPIAEVGKSGQSVQGGHCEMPVGGLPVMLKTMIELRRLAGSPDRHNR